MKTYDVIRTERRKLPKEEHILDLMDELYKKNENIIFSLTNEALKEVCEYSAQTFEIESVPSHRKSKTIGIIWTKLADIADSTGKWMLLTTNANVRYYFVYEAETEKRRYKRPKKGTKVVHYVIE